MISDTWRKYIRDAGFNNLARVASLCNRAEWEPLPEGIPKPPISKRKILGDASDAALLKCMEVLVKGGAESYRKVCEKVKIINESSLNISRSRRKKKKFADIRDTVQLDRQVPSQRLSVREEARGFLEGGARKSSGTVLDGRVRPRNEEARRRDQGRVHRVVLRPRQQR